MINDVYEVTQALLNKANRGSIKVPDFNKVVNLVTYEIYRGYFEDLNNDKNKDNRGLGNTGAANIVHSQIEKISHFAESATLSHNTVDVQYNLPSDIYIIEENTITDDAGNVVEKVERSDLGYLNISEAKPSTLYKVYTKYNGYIKVHPLSYIGDIDISYLRVPKTAKWTFMTISNVPLFNPSATDYQDLDLHVSEFNNVVVRVLGYLGLSIREAEVIQVSENIKNQTNLKDNS